MKGVDTALTNGKSQKRLFIYKKTAVEAKCYTLYYLNTKFLFNKPHYATNFPMTFFFIFLYPHSMIL